ncbi:hypothetical protein AVEN_228366-1 [Araneus ventricosus]|uniref:Uncharacterized protein n=1 Tax=Araneus ventricosus TaxID=182803 RepID=A0A4Y2LJZ3_ARAVE|nr:hypothetical protein AVEN_228366-1 [Araneus ventricosus]
MLAPGDMNCIYKAVIQNFDILKEVRGMGEGLVNVGVTFTYCTIHFREEGLQLDAFHPLLLLIFLEDIDICSENIPPGKRISANIKFSVMKKLHYNTLRYVSNRWLSDSSCQKFLKMYPALKQHFSLNLVGNKSDLIKTEQYKHEVH